LIGVGGFIDGPIPDEIKEEESMVFVFGPNGFFGYGATSPNTTMWWSTCSAENVPAERKISAEDMKVQLQARHGSWKDPIIKDILEHVDVTSIYPVWTLGSLPKWGSGGLLVLGDAAHALQPTSGQGASQALEDAKCFPLLLSKFLKRSKELQASKGSKAPPKTNLDDIIAMSAQAFYNVRAPRVKKIADAANRIAQRKKDQSIIEEMMLCGILYTIGKLPKVGKFNAVHLLQCCLSKLQGQAIMGDINKEMYYWPMDDLTDAAVDKLMPAPSQ
jgi:2-polyprenyl-6-methoxyphenol hydroxylase-like FAD-dependent oxidoreductase